MPLSFFRVHWLVVSSAALAIAASCGRSNDGPANVDRMRLPPTMLWAWERPEDLRSIDVASTGVALLAATITLDDSLDGGMEVAPRRQPLRLAPGTRLLPVVRIEVNRRATSRLDETLRARLADQLAVVAKRGGAIQIDFEATASERPFYRALLGDLRSRIGDATPLSITALTSWCLDDRWLAGLPVDEVVPMFYRMGEGAEAVGERLARDGYFPARQCRGALGLALDGPVLAPASPRRIYLFNPRPWTAARIAAVSRSPETSR